MSIHNTLPTLPTEILLNVLDFVAPSAALPHIALSPNHPTTKTLIALTYTSRALLPTARRLLYTHCLYIHTSSRLKKLATSLQSLKGQDNGDLLAHATSLYIRPFPVWDTIAEIDVANDIQSVLQILAPRLRRLLVDIPFRSVYPEDDPTMIQVQTVLRTTFQELPALEEFSSIRDEVYLQTEPGVAMESYIWSGWNQLKTLILYNVDVSLPKFWEGLHRLQNLETVVLTRADGLGEVEMKQEWKKQFGDGEERPLNMVLVNVEAEHITPVGSTGWNKEDKLQVRVLNVPISYYGDEDLIILCQHWIKRRVLFGEPVSGWD